MSKHTPGPWVMKPMGVICGGPFHQYARGSAQCQLAMVTLPREHDDEDTAAVRDANACLIAAAPDLLEALREALQSLEYVERMHGADITGGLKRLHDMQRARAAIAKAEGKE